MKTIKLITFVPLISFLSLVSLQGHAMSRAVAEEVCNQYADEEQVDKLQSLEKELGVVLIAYQD